MEVPAPEAGKISEILVKIGDKVSIGSAIVELDGAGASATASNGAIKTAASDADKEERSAGKPAAPAPAPRPQPPPRHQPPPGLERPPTAPLVPISAASTPALPSAASRASSTSTSPRSKAPAKRAASPRRTSRAPSAAAPRGAPAVSAAQAFRKSRRQDFSKFGPIETKPLSRLKKLVGPASAPRLAEHSPCHPHR